MDNGGNIILLFDEKKRANQTARGFGLLYYLGLAGRSTILFPPIYMTMIMPVQTDI